MLGDGEKTIGFQFCGREMLPIGNFRKHSLAKFSNSKMSQRGTTSADATRSYLKGSILWPELINTLDPVNSQVLNRSRRSIWYFDVTFTIFQEFEESKSLKVDFIDQQKF